MLVLLFSNVTRRIRWLDVLLTVITTSVVIGVRDFVQPALFKRIKVVIPIEFMMVVLAIGLSYGLDLHGRYDVRILGYMAVGYDGKSHINHNSKKRQIFLKKSVP